MPPLAGVSAAEARARIRRGEYTGQTAGVGPGMAQGNIAILPADWAEDFLRFCLRNPKPCPLLAVSEPGRTDLPSLGPDIDIRTDVPRYRVFRDGVAVDAPSDVLSYWRNDLVTFVLGCSLSFEWPLIEAGLTIRHIEAGTTVPMYRTKHRDRAGRALSRPARRVDAAVPPRRRDPRGAGDDALSRRAWRAGASSACRRSSASRISRGPTTATPSRCGATSCRSSGRAA